MPRILITSGPTREYLDPVRFLTNGSSGRMGASLAEAVLAAGSVPVVVSGPVAVQYPVGAEVRPVQTTDEMLNACLELFPSCAGVIAAAAPCDYKPVQYSEQKLSKKNNGTDTSSFDFVHTPDILAVLGQIKQKHQWSIGFALETEYGKEHALEKLKRKNCDFIVLNEPAAVNSDVSSVQVFDKNGELRLSSQGGKQKLAERLLELTAAFQR
ncbi:MAG: phosphopantothenoylcysteine decarboxylase [Planctomycetaceae bacterium]|jgi:phosphopantothenoylcysteine decarboxylase/phosphopantothenate--cysteine ligase|nr:phosphopantothenoylcysteine decarboxylase [Planctomycetaceae bacterium]